MTAVLPGFLQDKVLFGTFREQRATHFDEFPVDGGKRLRSKLPGSPDTVCSYTTIADEGEADGWSDFYIQACEEGSQGFYAEHPRLKATKVFWWASAPDIQHESSIIQSGATRDLYRVTCNWIME